VIHQFYTTEKRFI